MGSNPASHLSQEELEKCRTSFLRFDKDRNGTIDAFELRAALTSFGAAPSDEDLFAMIAEVDANANGVVDFPEFVRVLEGHKARVEALGSESDLVDAFVACGGNDDRSGLVERERLVKIVKEDFGLAFNISSLFVTYDKMGEGQMGFEE